MKKIATLVGSAALLAASLVPAIAATYNCTNGTTGPFSNNTCSITNTDHISVNNVNDAYIKNDVDAKSDTGHNSASTNTLGGSIKTGNATANVTVSNVANINTTNITSDLAGGAHNVGANSITGPLSDNNAFITNSFDAYLWNSNTAKVKNDVDVKSETGHNDANTNTGPAVINTGDAWLGLLVATHVNDNLNQISGGAGGSGSNTAENSTTGPFSNNTVSLTNRRSATVNNVNDLYVKNDVDAKADSGHNDANKNTLGGLINTGGAAAGVGVNTEGNINSTLVAMGGFTDNFGANSVTGPGGGGKDPNEVFITNSRDVVVDNWNNKCLSHNADDQFGHTVYWEGEWKRDGCDVRDLGVRNDVDVKTETGKNDANTNTGGGDIMSGFADLWQQVLTHMNDTLTQIY